MNILAMEREVEGADWSGAQPLLDTLPLVKSGLIRFELTQLLPYDGFSRLMGA